MTAFFSNLVQEDSEFTIKVQNNKVEDKFLNFTKIIFN